MRDVKRSGELDGYEPAKDYDAVNDIVAKQADCSNCGHHGLNCYEFQKYYSRRAFAVCPECNFAEEF